jgi:hypothetical protein
VSPKISEPSAKFANGSQGPVSRPYALQKAIPADFLENRALRIAGGMPSRANAKRPWSISEVPAFARSPQFQTLIWVLVYKLTNPTLAQDAKATAASATAK